MFVFPRGQGSTLAFVKKLERGEQNIVWTIEKLKKRFSMSDQQVYRRIYAAQRPLNRHMMRGDKNAIALTEGGFLILENVIELEKQGKTLANAVDEVEKSLDEPAPAGPLDGAAAMINGAGPRNVDKLHEPQTRSLIEEIGYLKGKLDTKEELLVEVKEELERLRVENENLKRSVALVEYKAGNEKRRWWPWR